MNTTSNFGLFHEQFNTIYRCFSVLMVPESERSDVERGGKIIMPTSALNTLNRLNIVNPMLFKLTNCYNRFTHSGVLEFVAEEGKVYLPQWMMKTLVLEEGSLVQVESVSLPMGSFIKFGPQSYDFLNIPDPKTVLKSFLRNFDCLTTGDIVSITYKEREYELCVLETKPGAAVSIIECDVNIEFAVPVGYRETENIKDKYVSEDKENGDHSSYQLLLTVISEQKSKYSEDLICFEDKDNPIDEKLKELTPKELISDCKAVGRTQKQKQKTTKVSVGTQTLRSYLREQALKQNSLQMNKQKSGKTSQTKLYETKAIQTSYSSRSSESDSTLINEKFNSLANLEQIERLPIGKEAISWFIPISKNGNKNITQICRPFSRTFNVKSKPYEHIMTTSSPVPLQEAFNRHCIDMRINSQIRVNRINTIADLRKRTADERLIEMAKQFIRQQESAKVIKTKIIQPVFKSTIKRFFTHEEMRAQTEKIYHNLPEVKAKREKLKQMEKEKNQRLLAQIYKYRLKDNALKGRMTWKITQSCLN